MAHRLSDGYFQAGLSHHRTSRSSLKRRIGFFTKRFGDLLYYIGLVVERTVHRTDRRIRKTFVKITRAVWNGLKAVARFFVRFTVTTAKDIIHPFVKAVTGIRNFFQLVKYTKDWSAGKRKRALKGFLTDGWNRNKGAVGRFFNHLLPIVGAGVFAFTVYCLVHLNFGLDVTYNGQHIGYVTNESSFDTAQKVIQERIINEDEEYVWTADNAELSISVVSEGGYSSESEIADALISATGTEITQATGLYVGGEFYGATVAGDLLQDMIDEVIQPYVDAAADDPETTVKFSRSVELVEGIYPSSSVMTLGEMESIIRSNEESNIYVTMRDGETLDEIADENGITVERIFELNPWIESESDLVTGDILLVSEGEPLLAVKTIKLETYTEEVSYGTEVIDDGRFYTGYYRTIVEGAKGERTITVEVEYENGEEIGRVVIASEITVEPKDSQVIRGTKSYNVRGGQVVGTGVLGWPTGSGFSISRGWTGYHRGIDIAVPMNTGIYAADSGTVIISQWTNTGYGYYVVIDHGNGLSTLYGHCNQLLVSVGAYVYRGQLIALSGSTGNSTGPHCHFEVRINGTRVDPAPYIY